MDNTTDSHTALTELMAKVQAERAGRQDSKAGIQPDTDDDMDDIQEAWIGGRTRPGQWHWIYNNSDTEGQNREFRILMCILFVLYIINNYRCPVIIF